MKEKFDKNVLKFMQEVTAQMIDGATVIHMEIGDGDIDGELKAFYVPPSLEWIVLMSANSFDSEEKFVVNYANFAGKGLYLLSTSLVNKMKEIQRDD
jgi:hypothetical protein